MDISATIQPSPPLPELEAQWRDLEARSNAPFFLTWTWIGTWLREAAIDPGIVVASHGDQVVGLGLVSRRVNIRRMVKIPSLYLNQVGDGRRDKIGMEYNGFLVDARLAEETRRACLTALLEVAGSEGEWSWRELHLDGITFAPGTVARDHGIGVWLRAERQCPYVALGRVRAAGGDIAAVLSRNTRQQVRRSMRLYEAWGPLGFRTASSVEEALDWLAELKTLHQRRWTQRGRPGAFAEPFFESFLRRLVRTGQPLGHVDIARAEAGDTPIGYLCNFVHRGTVYNYQTGFRYEDDGRYKPGLVSHALAIQHYLRTGAQAYNFLARREQYKDSLATDWETLYWTTLQRRGPLLRIEALARRLAGSGPWP